MPPVSGLPPASDLQATWSFLQEGIEIMMSDLTQGLEYKKYMNLYTVSYNYCTSNRMNHSEGSLGSSAKVGANVGGAELYEKLQQYFKNRSLEVLKGAADHTDEALLRYYAQEWARYTQGANFVHRLFTYLNRYWVKREKDEGKKNVYTVYTLALVQWRDHMFSAVQSKSKLSDAVLSQIQKQRNGEVIDTGLAKKVVDSFVSLGLDEIDTTQQNVDVYRTQFEEPFLATTEVYYRTESDAFVSANSVPDYMRKVESRLKEEEDRVELYLHPTTRNKLIAKCDAVLISGHSQLLCDYFESLLEAEQGEDLFRMYTLLSRSDKGLDPLRQNFEIHVRQKGMAAAERVVGTDADAMEPSAYVEALLEVHGKFLAVVTNSFRSEAGFLAALDKACRSFMNRNKATGESTSKCPELLAKHSDGLLKKSNKNAEEAAIEESLNQVMIIFKYIEDKDVFQRFYSRLLAKRLINFQSASDDAEASMISKLKESCGYEYTSKLQRMFTDMGLSKELNDQFKEHVADTTEKGENTADFQPLVLASGFWPLNMPSSELTIPNELLPMLTRFERYYAAKHSGRKLTWLWHQHRVDLSTNYLSQKHIFTTSIYQAAILLCFNSTDTLSYRDLQSSTNLNDVTLKGALGVLQKTKVLVKVDDASGSSDGASDKYSLNPKAKFKKMRMNLNMPIKSEAKAESGEVLKTVDEDRKLVLQATIVRIMKARKTLKHAQLVQECVGQVSSRFQPSVPTIKKAIESLIEKEYLERLEGSRDTLQYLA